MGSRLENTKPVLSARRRGFSLVEVMVGFAIFSVVAMGLTRSAIFSMHMSHRNVMGTTAYASAQGFLEQIKVLPEEDIVAALDDPSASPLPTRSISVLDAGSAIDVDDPIFLEDPNATAEGQNHKQIVIDIKGTGNGAKEIVMDVWFDLDITKLKYVKGYRVKLDFSYAVPGVASVKKQTGSITMVRSSQWGESF